ncbi:MAG TPA: hypothetical protein PK228_15555, partial [Saprospiraceae bacterium]|nr:hypothetical protein [Saprospiraceae bacterium]
MKHLVICSVFLFIVIPAIGTGCNGNRSQQPGDSDSFPLPPVPDNPPTINVGEYVSKQYTY